jgi:hypothetical protein
MCESLTLRTFVGCRLSARIIARIHRLRDDLQRSVRHLDIASGAVRQPRLPLTALVAQPGTGAVRSGSSRAIMSPTNWGDCGRNMRVLFESPV